MPNADDRKRRLGTSNSGYRRRKRVEPSTSETEPVEALPETEENQVEPGQMAQLIVDMRSGAVDREAASSIARPLTDLARAFALQAEVLKSVHENQAEMAKKLADDGKSQLIVNSTRALNDTFRGVRQTQEKLLDELRDRGQGSRKSILVWSLVALGALVAGWFVTNQLTERQVRDRDELQTRLGGEIANLRSEVEGDMGKQLETAQSRRVALERENEEQRLRIADLRGRLDEVAGKETVDPAELTALRKTAGDASIEIERLRLRVEELGREKTFYVEQAEKARAEVDRLRDEVLSRLQNPGSNTDQLAGSGVEKPVVAVSDDATNTRVETAQPLNEVGPDLLATVKTKTLEAARQRVNDLIGRHRRTEVYRLESVGKIGSDRLESVVFTESRSGEGVLRRIEAAELFFVVDPRGDLVDIEFRKGEVRTKSSQGILGPGVPFYNDRFHLTIEPVEG